MYKKLTTLTLTTLFFLINTSTTNAYSQDISPAQIEAVIAPGTQQTYEISLTNSAPEDITLTPTLYEFAPNTTWDGTTYLTSNKSLENTKPTLSSYFTLSVNGTTVTSLNIPSGEKKTLQLTIALPKDTEERDFYTTLMFEDKKQGTGTQIQTAAGTNILLSAKKSQSQNLSIEDFKTKPLYFKNPVSFNVLVANNGNHFSKSHATINIYNMFGKKTATLNSGDKIILANGKRFMTGSDNSELSYSQLFMFGLYKADLSLTNSSAKSSSTFLVIPLIPIILTTLVVGFGIGVYLRVKKKL